jgi:CheY-like chemotaxis protein
VNRVIVAEKPVLVVEDDEDFRNILQECLEDDGHAVTAAWNRSKALDLLRGGLRPGLIVMDLMMPGVDSETFMKELTTHGCRNVPVLVISAANSDQVPTPKGAAGRLLKPIDIDTLLDAVRAYDTAPGRH